MNWSGDTPGLPGITATRYPFPFAENVLIDPDALRRDRSLAEGYFEYFVPVRNIPQCE